jgi:hypothetical protein
MAIEENILSTEELSAIDPFASVSNESVLGFPEIQTYADGTVLEEHADEGTLKSVHHMLTNLDQDRTVTDHEKASIKQPDDAEYESARDWEQRLKRMLDRRNPIEPIPDAESHDFIAENESASFDNDEEDQPITTMELTIPDDSVLDELENIRATLESIGGISRKEVVALESLVECPNYFGNPRMFSAAYTTTKYDTTMEALGLKIKEIVLRLVEQILNFCRTIGRNVISMVSEAFQSPHMTVSLLVRRREVLAAAKRIDAVYGMKAFKEMTSASDIPPYTEATSTEDFCMRYLDYKTKERFRRRFTTGQRMIAEGAGLSGHVKALRGELGRLMQQTEDYVNLLVKNDPANWPVNMPIDSTGIDRLAGWWKVGGGTLNETLSQYREAINFAFRQEDTGARRPWEFVKVANYSNPFTEDRNFGSNISRGIDSVSRKLKEVERGVKVKLDDASSYNVNTRPLADVQRRLTALQSLFSIYAGLLRYYESFYHGLSLPLTVLDRQLRILRGRKLVSSMLSSESYPETVSELVPDLDDAETIKIIDGYPGGHCSKLLETFHRASFLNRSDIEDEYALELLMQKKLIHRPKVLDLEQDTPDYGITPNGRRIATQIYGDIHVVRDNDSAIKENLDMIWDDERTDIRDALRLFGEKKYLYTHEIPNKDSLSYLEKQKLIYRPFKHPLEGEESPDWLITALGTDVFNRL